MLSLKHLTTLLLPFSARASPFHTTPRQTAPDALSAAAPAAAAACDDVHIFLARGTNEEYPGRQISVVYAICNGTGDAACGYEDVQYPATLVLPEYCTSEGLGVTQGTAQIEAYAASCPDSQLVLSGYSQVCEMGK